MKVGVGESGKVGKRMVIQCPHCCITMKAIKPNLFHVGERVRCRCCFGSLTYHPTKYI